MDACERKTELELQLSQGLITQAEYDSARTGKPIPVLDRLAAIWQAPKMDEFTGLEFGIGKKVKASLQVLTGA